jgi:hypothetical protein
MDWLLRPREKLRGGTYASQKSSLACRNHREICSFGTLGRELTMGLDGKKQALYPVFGTGGPSGNGVAKHESAMGYQRG